MHYYKFNIGNYNRRVGNLSNIADLAYRRMLDIYYLDESPLPNDVKKIARKIGMIDYVEDVQYILEDFFYLDNNEWHNDSADSQISEYQANAKNSRENGKLGGRPKKQTQNKPSGLSTGTQQAPTHNLNQEPITKNQEPKEKIPYPQIVESYNNNFANSVEGRGIIKLENITPDRKRAIKKLIEHSKKLDIEHWNNYFKYCAGVPFLNGSTDKYKADFDMLIRVKSYIKNTEGGYQ